MCKCIKKDTRSATVDGALDARAENHKRESHYYD